ncbi:SlyX family protein [Kushneria aurantia]|uniref:SlyX family protein n=1 Tax=Kushneria aurantia TaxID=504092 RepID=A0ABV6G5L7_9GAMM|nr:SlyX family protein [Kushneria aurantia]
MESPPQRDDSNTTIDTTLERVLARVDDLESRLAWQENWLERLDQTLIHQSATIERLERRCQLMATRLGEHRSALEALGGEPEGSDERPPHY